MPPLELTGERTLPDVPEENYWYRRHLAVYEWIARSVGGMTVTDLACGEGYGSASLAETAADVIGVDANPEAHAHAAARYVRPNLRFERDLVENVSGPRDAIVFLQTIEHIEEVEELLDAIAAAAPLAYISTPNRLTLAPEGAEKSDNPWHLREYTSRSTGSCSSPTSARSRSSASTTRASSGSISGRSTSAGTGSTRRCDLTDLFYDRFTPAISASDFELKAGDLDSALDFVAICRQVSGGRPPRADVGDIAIVLHSHMPYVEGFGTYPFGEEWLFDAFLRSHLPVLAVGRELTMTVTPVLADQLEAPGRRGAAAGVRRAATGSARPSSTPRTWRRRSCAPPARPRRSATRRRSASSSELGGDLLERLHGARRGGPGRADRLERHPRDPAADRDPRGRSAADRDRPALAPAPLRAAAAASGCPSAPTSPGSSELLAESGIEYFCIDQSAHEPPERRAARRSRSAPLTALPDRLGGDPVALVAGSGYPSTRCYADFHRKSLRGCRPWAIGGERLRPRRGRAPRRASRRRSSRPPSPTRLAAHRDRARPGRACSPSRSTPSCSATGGGRGRSGCEAVARAPARARRPAAARSARRAASTRPSRDRPRRSSWGEGKDLRTWDSRRGRRPCLRRPPARAAAPARAARRPPARRRAASAPRASCSALQASDWAFLDYRGRRATTPSSGCSTTPRRSSRP